MGVLVLFGLSDINFYYGLVDVGQVKYKKYLENVDYNKVIESLAVEGAEWDYFNGKPKGFEAKHLGKVAHI